MKKYITILALIISGISSAQQTSLNSQYLFNEMIVNPGATGAKDYVPIQLNFRKQWTSFPGSPTTQTLSAHSAIGKNMGLGGVIFNDLSGPSRRTGFNINTAFHFQLDKNNEHHLGLGIGVSITLHYMDITALNTYLPDDPAVMRGFNNQMVPDANFGVFYRYKDKGFAGISVSNLIELSRDLYNFDIPLYNPLRRTYYFIGGYHFNLGREFGLKVTNLTQIIETGTWQTDGTLMGTYKNKYWVGVSYRHTDAVVFLLGAQFGPFKFGYAYDYTLSDIGKYSSGSHEVFLELQVKKSKSQSDSKTPWIKRNRIFTPKN